MSKKLFSIGMVKNEADVIESHVRYNINIFDGMIILDNGSTDETLKIMEKLKKEGLNLFIIEDSDREYNQASKMNNLLLMAVDEFKADVIVPLDADEFLISNSEGNPRTILESMEPNTFYLAKWKTYMPEFNNKQSERFIPSQMTNIRDEKFEDFYKVVVPRELVENHNVELTMGNHDLSYDSGYGVIKRLINDDIKIAHFPIRSKDQTISKIAVGWIYSLYRMDRTGTQQFHWKIIFDKIKENKEISNDDVLNFAKQFALRDEGVTINIKEDPMDLSFCQDLKIKYTPDKINPISNLLEGCEWLSNDFLESKKELISDLKQAELKNKQLSHELNKLKTQNLQQKEKFKRKIREYENSTSWMITKPLRKFSGILRRN